MPASARIAFTCLFGLLMFGQTACNVVPYHALKRSQFRSMQLAQQNQALAADRDQARQNALANEDGLNSLQSQLDTANHRLSNLNSERSELHRRYINVLNRPQDANNPLSESATRKLEELAKKYPEFEFDPYTGVSKFHSDVLFNSGSAKIKGGAHPLLSDFSGIMNSAGAERLNILVVGHTDDRRIIKRTTKSAHPTNWHLSTNRANSVVLALTGMGIKEARMGVAGYSKYQPVSPNTNEKSRQQNRRVEIFVLAPDAVVAGWDPGTDRN